MMFIQFDIFLFQLALANFPATLLLLCSINAFQMMTFAMASLIAWTITQMKLIVNQDVFMTYPTTLFTSIIVDWFMVPSKYQPALKMHTQIVWSL